MLVKFCYHRYKKWCATYEQLTEDGDNLFKPNQVHFYKAFTEAHSTLRDKCMYPSYKSETERTDCT